MLYNREKAVAYAHKWAYGRNPAFYDFSQIGGDCTNFASQVVYAGAGVMNETPVYGWYYHSVNDRAPAWTGVNEFYRFLTQNTGPGPQAVVTGLSEVMPGDVIQLQFQPGDTFDHSPVVVDAGERTPRTILLAAHTNDADCRPLATYNYVNYRCLHIINVNP